MPSSGTTDYSAMLLLLVLSQVVSESGVFHVNFILSIEQRVRESRVSPEAWHHILWAAALCQEYAGCFLGVASPFFPDPNLSRKPQKKNRGNINRFLKRTMVEKNEHGINPIYVFSSWPAFSRVSHVLFGVVFSESPTRGMEAEGMDVCPEAVEAARGSLWMEKIQARHVQWRKPYT